MTFQVLLSKEQAIKDNTYGSIVWKNCNLKAFKLGVNSWEEAERKKKKKLQSFEKIIGDKVAETEDKELNPVQIDDTGTIEVDLENTNSNQSKSSKTGDSSRKAKKKKKG